MKTFMINLSYRGADKNFIVNLEASEARKLHSIRRTSRGYNVKSYPFRETAINVDLISDIRYYLDSLRLTETKWVERDTQTLMVVHLPDDVVFHCLEQVLEIQVVKSFQDHTYTTIQREIELMNFIVSTFSCAAYERSRVRFKLPTKIDYNYDHTIRYNYKYVEHRQGILEYVCKQYELVEVEL
jgi:hypothetical protein